MATVSVNQRLPAPLTRVWVMVMDGAKLLKSSEFGDAMIKHM